MQCFLSCVVSFYSLHKRPEFKINSHYVFGHLWIINAQTWSELILLKYSLLAISRLEYNVGSVDMLSWPGMMMSWVFVYFGLFFPSLKVMHCTVTVICGMQMWTRAVFNVCCICRQGLEEQRSFGNIKKLLPETHKSKSSGIRMVHMMDVIAPCTEEITRSVTLD